MLHSAAQKQLHNFNPAALEDDIAGIRDALGVLSFCASSDRIATKFLQQLTDSFNQILTQQSATVCGGLLYGEGDMESQSVTSFSVLDEGLEGRDLGDFGYLLTIPSYGTAFAAPLSLSQDLPRRKSKKQHRPFRRSMPTKRRWNCLRF